MRRIRKQHALGVVVLAAAVGALVVSAAQVQAGNTTSGVVTKIGKGEGRLNLVEWPYYSDKSFAKPFERQTGCIIHRKDAGTSGDMFSAMHANGGGGGGQWDLVSASGDASLRLIYAHDVKPIDIHLIPSWKDFIPVFKSPAHNTVAGKHYGVSHGWGGNTLMWRTDLVTPAPTSWDVTFDPAKMEPYKGKVTAYDGSVWVVGSYSDRVTRIDPGSLRVTGTALLHCAGTCYSELKPLPVAGAWGAVAYTHGCWLLPWLPMIRSVRHRFSSTGRGAVRGDSLTGVSA